MATDSAQKQGMCKRFELCPTIGMTTVADVEIPLKSRDELPPVLLTLKTIFVTPEYHTRMFEIVEPGIQNGKQKLGRVSNDNLGGNSFAYKVK